MSTDLIKLVCPWSFASLNTVIISVVLKLRNCSLQMLMVIRKHHCVEQLCQLWNQRSNIWKYLSVLFFRRHPVIGKWFSFTAGGWFLRHTCIIWYWLQCLNYSWLVILQLCTASSLADHLVVDRLFTTFVLDFRKDSEISQNLNCSKVSCSFCATFCCAGTNKVQLT